MMHSKPSKHTSIISIPPSKVVVGATDRYGSDRSSFKAKRTHLLLADSVNHDHAENRNYTTTKSTPQSMSSTMKKKNPHALDITRIRRTSIQVVNKKATRSQPTTNDQEMSDNDESYAEEMQYLRTATAVAKKLRAAPSRTGTASDPYAFELKRVRSLIRRESIHVAPTTAQKHF